jgi:hypothetical protein
MKIFFDWFQVSCYGSIVHHPDYDYKDEEKRTKQFLKLLEVYKYQEHIATICYIPSSKTWRTDLVIVKFQNKILYNYNIAEYCVTFLTDHNLKFNNITRVDLCTDFNYFYNHMNPRAFITRLMKNKILGNNRCAVRLEGFQKERWRMHYLRYGSHRSLASVYLYNKSKEMQDKIFKPYIFDQWQQMELNTELPIWRLEFSLRPGNFNFYELNEKNQSFEYYKAYLNQCNKENVLNPLIYDDYCTKFEYKPVNRWSIKLEFLKDIHNVNMLFQGLLDHYFKFLFNNYKKNKSENQKLQLFPKYKSTGSLYIFNQDTNSTRMDKILCNHLLKIDAECNENYQDISEAIKIVREYINDTRGFDKFKQI